MSVDSQSKQTQSFRWSKRAIWPALAAALIVGPSPFFGGCDLLKKPAGEAVPTKVPEVYKNPNEFLSSANTPATEMLNDPTGKDATKPAFFRLTQVEAGDLLILQGITVSGTTELLHDKPIKVKLAGVFSPQPGPPPEAGWKDAADAASAWLSGRELNVEQDAKFKITPDNRKVVQIRFEGKGKLAGQSVSFNQLLVRSGYAWVDLTSSSSFDYKLWVADEEYARGKRVPFTAEDKKRAEDAFKSQFLAKNATKNPVPPVPTLTPLPKAAPVGLWAKNIRPPFRITAPGGAKPGTIVGSEDIAVPTPPPDATTAAAGSPVGGSGSMPSTSATGSSPMMSATGSPPMSSATSPPMSSGSSNSARP